MDRCQVLISPTANKDLDGIFSYIKSIYSAPQSASQIVKLIKKSISELEYLPHRGSNRMIGIFANKGYKQLFVSNYILIYRINEEKKQVIIITVKHSKRNF